MLQILLNQQKTEVRQKPATKKILILGTSNSLFKGGWVAGLSHALQGYQIKNMSVGASQGFQFAGIVSQENFSQYDYVFFDSLANEESYCLGRQADKYHYTDQVERLLYELMSTIASQTNLIVMGFCKHYAFDKESEIFQSRRRLTQNVGGYFFDIRKMLKLHMMTHSLTIQDIYDETQHPKREISYEIGRRLGSVLESISLDKYKYAKDYSGNFSRQKISLKDKTKEYKNSVMSLGVSRISKEDSIGLNNHLRCIGFYLNAIKTNCYVECSYQGKSVQEIGLLYTVYNEQAENFQKIFVGLQDFPVIDTLRIIGSDTDFQNLYFPLITHKQKLPSLDALELSEVLYWDDKNALDPYPNDIFSYDESMLLTYKVINSIIG
ncbi:hypothetical protein [Acinetobacter thermotolerans]|uniref:hypothetical protein n=1 Tax=Acinetobacter thermotolerans TaxID=3151487 RepID=UPI00325AF323